MLPPAGRFQNLIVASTFYHVILAYIIARDARFAGSSLLVLDTRRPQVAALCEPLAKASDSPFTHTMALPAAAGKKPERERAQGRWLARLDDTVRPGRVVIFSDLTPDLQLLCRRAQARGAHTFCGEDGGTVYSSRSAASPWRRHWQRVLRFGPWVQNVAASGSSRHVRTCLALHAELVRPELRRKAVWPLPQADLSELLDSTWIAAFLAHFDVTRAELACDELYVPAYGNAGDARERLRARLREELRAARQAGRDCVVKYHPRARDDFLGAVELDARVLPAAIPAELVYLASGQRLTRVIGDSGTTLLSARWLAPQAQALSAAALAPADPWYERTLERLGVERLSPDRSGAQPKPRSERCS